MSKTRNVISPNSVKEMRPALTPEGRENQLISLSVDLAEKQLREGTASSQVITHFLKLGTTQAKLELERTKLENELIKAKTKAVNSNENAEKLYQDAIKAFQRYSGSGAFEENDEANN